MLGAFGDLLRTWAIVLGGVSIVALVHATHARKAFETALANAATRDTGDIPSLKEWDFRYWHTIGLWTAGFSILCSLALLAY